MAIFATSPRRAYLAAAKALLMHLVNVADDRAAAQDLAAKIDGDMLQNSASLQLCRHSLESFSSGEIIYPEWADVRVNPLSVLLLIAALGLLTRAIFMKERRHQSP